MLFFSKENGFCIFYQFWVWNEKKFFEKIFVLFFAQKHRVWKTILTPLSGRNVARKRLYNLRNQEHCIRSQCWDIGDERWKIVKNSVFSKFLLKKTHEAEFVSKTFRILRNF